MNSKPLVFVVFAVWSIICWRWYVCGIMDACGDNQSSKDEVVAIRPDTMKQAETPEIQPLDNEKSEAAPKAVTPASSAPACVVWGLCLPGAAVH